MWVQIIALILVVADLTAAGVDIDGVNYGRLYGNGVSNDDPSRHRSNTGIYRSFDYTLWLYVGIGSLALVLFGIALVIYSCLNCSSCPAYKYHQRRNQGAVFSADVPPQYHQQQQQPATFIHAAVLNRNPGIVYVQGVSQQLPACISYYNDSSGFPKTAAGIYTPGNSTLEPPPDYDSVPPRHATARPVNET
ncbi:uncharacterized protein LOC110835774 [Zootermopsis nevadensis]|uniref:Uncharacterized protein n=1 Tax=Zootermopsis nevadensis TaxID=136037 RepID=A0A067QV58_ZOONE|nr:uncharacterized protein LOC110835774 [Zootermopsis nevadensis]KDR12942.1 hypothetical protein L798_12899 [Zootermopsis nevadensis]